MTFILTIRQSKYFGSLALLILGSTESLGLVLSVLCSKPTYIDLFWYFHWKLDFWTGIFLPLEEQQEEEEEHQKEDGQISCNL